MMMAHRILASSATSRTLLGPFQLGYIHLYRGVGHGKTLQFYPTRLRLSSASLLVEAVEHVLQIIKIAKSDATSRQRYLSQQNRVAHATGSRQDLPFTPVPTAFVDDLAVLLLILAHRDGLGFAWPINQESEE